MGFWKKRRYWSDYPSFVVVIRADRLALGKIEQTLVETQKIKGALLNLCQSKYMHDSPVGRDVVEEKMGIALLCDRDTLFRLSVDERSALYRLADRYMCDVISSTSALSRRKVVNVPLGAKLSEAEANRIVAKMS